MLAASFAPLQSVRCLVMAETRARCRRGAGGGTEPQFTLGLGWAAASMPRCAGEAAVAKAAKEAIEPGRECSSSARATRAFPGFLSQSAAVPCPLFTVRAAPTYGEPALVEGNGLRRALHTEEFAALLEKEQWTCQRGEPGGRHFCKRAATPTFFTDGLPS